MLEFRLQAVWALFLQTKAADIKFAATPDNNVIKKYS